MSDDDARGYERKQSTWMRLSTDGAEPAEAVYAVDFPPPSTDVCTHAQIGDVILERQPDGDWAEVARGQAVFVLDSEGGRMEVREQ